jgi:8-oxo-dGTP pyrophosphatase MutT (NUDIX family)
MLEPGEDPADACRRELMEETGFPTREIHRLGNNSPCAGRLSNRIHSFFVTAGERVADHKPEPAITTELWTTTQLMAKIRAGEFAQQLHIGALLLAELHGHIRLPR